jgi:hypothetical protein
MRPPSLSLNPRIEHAVCDLTALGLPLGAVARELRIPERCLYEWWEKGRGDDPPPLYGRFAWGLEAARQERQAAVQAAVALARERVSPRTRPPAIPTPRP